MEAIWNNIKKQKFDPLREDIKTDVLIIGGGLSGLLCAYLLKEAGVSCVLVEANEICSGITNGTTAKITIQHGLIYDKISGKYGEETARKYYESQKSAFEELCKLVSGRDCDFEISDSFVYSRIDRKVIEKETQTLNKIGCKAEFCEKTELPFDVLGAVKVPEQANFHPLKFVFSIAKDLPIYENTKILELKPGFATTANGKIFADKIIVATHFPFINKHGAYFIKMYQHRSYVLALKNASKMKGMYVDESMEGLSFRGYKDLLLVGGGSHRTGNDGGGWTELERISQRHYPEACEVGRWATQDCMTLDSMPYIGKYSKSTPDLYVATGFNKWGMTSSMLSAMILTDMLCGKENEYAELYSPSRSVFHPQLAANALESLKGMLTPTVPRCPHLGCALKYNKQEHSWDCPCHGSRFSDDGTLIDNPATDGKKI